MKIKKFFAGVLAASVFISMPVSAAVVEFTIGETDFLTEQGSEVTQKTVEAPPYVNESDRTMVPIRTLSEAFGAQVGWDEASNAVTVTGQKEIKLTIDNTTACVDGEAVTLDSAPVLVNGRTFVPLRFVSEAFGYNVQYVASTEQIVIDDSPLIYDFGANVVTVREVQLLWEILEKLNGEAMSAYAAEYLEALCMSGWFQEIFPDINLKPEDCEAISASIKESAASWQPDLAAMNALLHEKLYLINSDVMYRYFTENYDLENLYKQCYACAKHVLVEDEATAWAVYRRAAAGEDFDALIQQYGKDPGTAYYPEGYVFTIGEMVASFEEAAFALEVGAISEPVESEYGYHIIKREALPSMSEETLSGIIDRIQMEQMQKRNLANPQMLIEPELLGELITGTADEEV